VQQTDIAGSFDYRYIFYLCVPLFPAHRNIAALTKIAQKEPPLFSQD